MFLSRGCDRGNAETGPMKPVCGDRTVPRRVDERYVGVAGIALFDDRTREQFAEPTKST